MSDDEQSEEADEQRRRNERRESWIAAADIAQLLVGGLELIAWAVFGVLRLIGLAIAGLASSCS